MLAGKQLSQPRATLDFKQTRIGTIDDRAVLCAFGFLQILANISVLLMLMLMLVCRKQRGSTCI